MSAIKPALPAQELDRLCVDTIRALTMDAVERAGNGHPGMPMALAPLAYVLFSRVLRHNPRDPRWPDRDRFVLSAGHGSMLLYSALHLSGYDLSLDDLKDFRQLGSRTPGHPERDHAGRTPGVETTTGPLGQGFGNAVGMAMAERFLRDRYGEEIVDHRVFAVCSDGDLMEGVASEAASLAGHLGLGRLVVIYDDNRTTIDGDTALTFGENVEARFAAYRWHVLSVHDVNDLGALQSALREAIAETERPTLVRVRSIIGYPSPTLQNTSKVHGARMGAEEVRETKLAMGWDPDAEFVVPPGVYEHFSAVERGERRQRAWEERMQSWRHEHPELAQEWDRAWTGRPEPGLADMLPSFDVRTTPQLATRSASGAAMAALGPFVPTSIGGSADLAGSVKTSFPGERAFTHAGPGRNVFWGVREHGMAAAVNGLALHGGIVRPYGSTFLMFADYMRPSLRLSALMELDVTWVFSHDSLAVGEDGPTHQPIEHLAALRAIPGLTVIRPADANEAVEAWRVIATEIRGPVCLILTRQDVPVFDRTVLASARGLARGAYVLADEAAPSAVLVATGSEVAVALAAREVLRREGVAARVVSMPSWELFAAQSPQYRESVLPHTLPKLAVEAGISQGWERWVDDVIAVDRFGVSGPGDAVLRHLGVTPEAAAAAVRGLLAQPAWS